METNIQTETTFYQDAQILVTPSRYVTDAKTYAMRNISSVHVFEIVKSKTLQVIVFIIGLLLMFNDDLRILGFIFSAGSIGSFFLVKNEYAVRISTNSGEANSLVSKDKIYIQQIVNALNDAIIHRG
jgi:hypothetical protein